MKTLKDWMTKTNNSAMHVPLELTEKILLSGGLKVKDLLRFKCVCKTWNDLISSSRFARERLKLSEADPRRRHQKILECWPKPTVSDYNGFYATKSITPHPQEFSRDCLKIVGSCDGLVCLLSGFPETKHLALHLWNPSTKELVTLPTPIHHQSDQPFTWFDSINLIYGFGRDSHASYKLVLGYPDANKSDSRSHAFYSLKSSGGDPYYWRRGVDESNHEHSIRFITDEIGTLFDGVFHWPATSFYSEDNHRRFLLSYDCTNDKTRITMVPDCRTSSWFCTGVYDGCFSVIFCPGEDEGVELWSMREYGVEESWVKLMELRLSMPLCRVIEERFRCFHDGDILAEFNSKILVSHNSKANNVAAIAVPIMVYATIFVESLISPRSMVFDYETGYAE